MAGRAELDRGRYLRAKSKSLRKPTWNHHEQRQNNLFEIVCQRFCFFLTKKTWFHRKKIYFCMTNIYSLKKPEFEPLVSTWEPVFWSPWLQLKNMTCLTCTVAVILQKILPAGVGGMLKFLVRELRQRRFWATHVDWKWDPFHFKMTWQYQICV